MIWRGKAKLQASAAARMCAPDRLDESDIQARRASRASRNDKIFW
jgi:hypothetical protein